MEKACRFPGGGGFGAGRERVNPRVAKRIKSALGPLPEPSKLKRPNPLEKEESVTAMGSPSAQCMKPPTQGEEGGVPTVPCLGAVSIEKKQGQPQESPNALAISLCWKSEDRGELLGLWDHLAPSDALRAQMPLEVHLEGRGKGTISSIKQKT